MNPCNVPHFKDRYGHTDTIKDQIKDSFTEGERVVIKGKPTYMQHIPSMYKHYEYLSTLIVTHNPIL